MKIAIIGSGRVGSTLARAWAAKGYDVLIGARDPAGDTARHLAVTIEATAMTPEAAAAAGDVIVLALPWNAAESVISTLGELTGNHGERA